MNAKPLRDSNLAERTLLIQTAIWIGAPALLLLLIVEVILIPHAVLLLLVPDLLVIAGLIWIVWNLMDGFAAIARLFLMPDSVAASHGYSEQEALVARGHRIEALDSYRTHIVAYPGDLTARLRLAALLAEDPQQATEAEQVFLDIRRRKPSRQEEWIIGNGLIDLYRRSGDRWKLHAEMERLVHRYGATDAGRSAAAFLRELENETPRSLPLSE